MTALKTTLIALAFTTVASLVTFTAQADEAKATIEQVLHRTIEVDGLDIEELQGKVQELQARLAEYEKADSSIELHA